MKRTIINVLILLLIGILASFSSGCSTEVRRAVKPFNRVVILVDASGTMMIPNKGLGGKVPFAESVRLLKEFFVKAAERQDRRWDTPDDYHIIAIDAHSQEIWQGDRKALSSLTPEELEAKLATRKQYKGCTDIGAAFNEAIGIFNRAPQPTAKYLLSFSDLLNEPPSGSYSKCAAPSGEPPSVAWSQLSDVSMSFYWVSSDFRYKPDQYWREKLQQAGFTEPPLSFSDASQTVSRGISLAPPPKAHRVQTQEEIDQAKENVEHTKSTVLSVLGWGAAILVLTPLGLYVAAKARRGKTKKPGQNRR